MPEEPYISDAERRDLTSERNALQVATLRDLIVGDDADKTLHYEVAYQRRVAVTLKAIEDDLGRQTIATPAKVLHLPSPG